MKLSDRGRQSGGIKQGGGVKLNGGSQNEPATLAKGGSDFEALTNRLVKRQRYLQRWAKSERLTAYRLYDRDLPEHPYIIDCYNQLFVIYDRSRDSSTGPWGGAKQQFTGAVAEGLKTLPTALILKERRSQKAGEQYQPVANLKTFKQIEEQGRLYLINATDYLDTGLFLDHRPLRQRLHQTHSGRLLNLFCYTGSISVAAALGGAQTFNIDLSSTYLNWAKENFACNTIPVGEHRFERADVLQWLASPFPNSRQPFDTIFCDPPTYSRSKGMDQDFEVQRDQLRIIEGCMKRLAANGKLWFSTNKRSFRLATEVAQRYHVSDYTKQSIPPDFRDQKIHQLYLIEH